MTHCLKSYAASITFPYEKGGKRETFKLTYSGDAIPCDEIIKLGRDSTLLIHEATFMDDKRELASKSSHSTVNQAIEQGKLMNAEYIILTHFCYTYGTMLPLKKRLPENVGIAFDYMHVTYNDLHRMSSLIPSYSETFGQRPKSKKYSQSPIIKHAKRASKS